MQPLEQQTDSPGCAERIAELVMETVTAASRAFRNEMREHRPAGLSMQQFRALKIVYRHPGASLSTVAGHLGLTDASASRLVESLVRSQMLSRSDAPEDRRRVELHVTQAGERALEDARAAALGKLARALENLTESELKQLEEAMCMLRSIFADEQTGGI